MKKKSGQGLSGFEKISASVTKAAGSTSAFVGSFLLIIIWLLCGPIFDFSDTWQLVINTGTTIITFLMVFLIQRSQNKDSIAVHLKLNELLASHEIASNRLVSVEDISEAELKVLQKFYKHLAMMSKDQLALSESHSINEANMHHERKLSATKTGVKKSKAFRQNNLKEKN